MRKLTQALLLAGAVGMPALMASTSSMADEAPNASPVTGNMAFVSNYVFRGLTQSWNKPAVQAGLDYVHPSGFYLGTWASSISDKEYNNASMEWDFYAGYNGKINDDMGWGVGAIQIWYPGGKLAGFSPDQKYNTQELNASFNYKFVSVKYSYALTDLFGLNQNNFFSALDPATAPTGGTKGSTYLEANASHEIMDKLFLGAHIGHQKVKNASAYSYTDYKISLNKELPKKFFGLNVGLAYTDTNASKDAWTAAYTPTGETKCLGDKTWILSVSKTF